MALAGIAVAAGSGSLSKDGEADGGAAVEAAAGGVPSAFPVGSPGAVMPIRAQIAAMIRHYVPEVADVHIADARGAASATAALQQQVQDVLDTRVNPAVKAHGGAIRLEAVEDGTARLRFEGRCQGCAMAEVTLRQGVEVLLREHVPALTGIIDITDHPAGRDPYFKTRKGAE